MMNKKEVSLVLEGGGVKCAYQVGAIMALEELGYTFNAISGASYGAVNGALYLEGGVKRLFDYFTTLKTKDIFVEDNLVEFVENYNGDKLLFTKAFLSFVQEHSSTFMSDRNVISDYYHSYIAHLVNEEAVRNSPLDYMCSVLEVENSPLIVPLVLGAYFASNIISLSSLEARGVITSRIIDKNTCPKGSLARFIAGSANYPFFSPFEVDGAYYLDGGITNNVPYKALLEKGYQKLVIIRTKTDESQGKIPQNEDISVIIPSENLGSSLAFTHDNIMYLIKLGYTDTMAQIKKQ